MSRKIKIGVIGVGNMGSGHAMMFSDGRCPEFELAAICDINPARLEAVANSVKAAREKAGIEAPELRLFTNAEEMLDSGLIEAVTVAVPHYDHPKYVIAAIKRGIHVVCEKPAGVYTKAVREMIRVADEHPDVVFAMMFNQRTNPVYKKMKEIIASGELGAIKRVNWIITTWYRPQGYYDSGDWRATWSGEGGGVLLNQCPHQLDLWQWICGMPCRLDAKLHYGKWHNIEVEDDVTAYVEYPNGATGVFITSTGDAPGTNRFEILCDGGRLICEGESHLYMTKLEVKESEFRNNAPNVFASPKGHTEEVDISDCGQNLQHVGVFNAFAGKLLRGTPLIADGREGINGLTISNAMHLSSWTGGPVDLPFDEDLYKAELDKRVATSCRRTKVVEQVSTVG